jgi:SAM-dependent methyltransferase
VISFIPDPAKAVAEMARVVRPGGIVATYMWDIPGGGLPLAPVGRAFKAMGKEYSRTSDNASRREVMQTLWQGAGLREVETRIIRITVDFTSFDDFCDSSLVPIGPAGQVIAKMSPAELEELKAHLRKLLPIAADGSIAYEAFANAVKGRVPGV